MKINKIEKVKAILYIYLEGKDHPVKYDFANKSYYSYTGRQVKSFPKRVFECGGDWRTGLTKNEKNIITIISRSSHPEYLEPFINCIDLIDMRQALPKECPKGYIKYLQENNKKASQSSLDEFKTLQIIKNLSPDNQKLFMFFVEHMKQSYFFEKANLPLQLIMLRILKTDMKTFHYNFHLEFNEFDKACFAARYSLSNDTEKLNEILIKNLDTNRGFAYNAKIIYSLIDILKFPNLINNQKKIKVLEELSSNNYLIKVPVSFEELNDEGKQQHNCVGHFYHERINNGTDFIYFIRKKDKPNKSNTTCRYTLRSSSPYTQEYRIVNNNSVSDEEVLELIKTVDKFCAEHFSEIFDE